ncbi:hypothetical protein UFOVP4_40 [uncultured Caudovirales phage]|uniref:Uncharacterized protein n=1 Tax=uncultured Caudovirales phage TaxID=2100421 RepID=A0A6J5T9L5_9CAUD|nr:hypothetical protein UFOVP4_40 [uncultured Caudovirales phage]CAB4241261.1 hypothetical protein UFOVP64_20 [uncultured Caudovirales phage]CAB5078993.1 hypothetical protein UFOVP145_34 [uncultured Caudovirales phage]
MKPRTRDDLGPAREAERSRLLLELRARSPKRPRAPQDNPATLELFAAALEPSLF